MGNLINLMYEQPNEFDKIIKEQNKMNVRAKFKCNSVKKSHGNVWHGNTHTLGFLYDYEFSVVTDGSEENKKFFASTPSGMIKLSSVRDDTWEPGKEYYIDFTLAGE